MTFEQQPDLLKALDRARRSPAFVASLYAPWEKAFGGTVAKALSAGPDAVASLGLCLRPRDDRWSEDIAEIADACHLDVGDLAALLRQALAVERMAGAPRVSQIVDGRLLAARDRDEEKNS
jgi:hypothetical protein